MVSIGLINMPFSDIQIPSIALAQIKSVTNEIFGEKARVDEFYFNLEMAQFLGTELYSFISNSGPSNTTGFGDWFFRQQAFPELPDNEQDFFERYSTHFSPELQAYYFEVIKPKRLLLGDFLQELIDRHGLDKYDMIGFTSMFMQNVPSFGLARKIRELNPNCIILMGGANCESPMGEEIVKNVPFIDYTFSGTTLRSFPLFLQHYMDGEMDKTHQIDGVFSKKNCLPPSSPEDLAGFKLVKPVGEERPLDEVVELDYDHFLDLYESKFPNAERPPYLLFETSRGCWWGAKSHCTFCGLNGGNMSYRAISPPKALDYFNGLFNRYSQRVNHFSCVDNIIPREYFTDVFPNLKVPDNVTMFYEVKADLTAEDMEMLSAMHIYEVQPGVEALNTTTLKLMRKGTTASGNIRLLKFCITYGIAPSWNLLIGFPGETEEIYAKYMRDLPLLFHLTPPAGVFPVRFDRYSPYFTKAKEYGLNLQPLDYYNLIYPFDKETLSTMAYYFADHNYEAEYIRITAQWVTKLKPLIEKWNNRWSKAGLKAGRPRLYIYQDSIGRDMIFDSRGDKEERFPLSEEGRSILAALATHRSKASVVAELKDIPADIIDEELEFLQQKGLIFEERGSLMSLVFDKNMKEFTKQGYHTYNIAREEAVS